MVPLLCLWLPIAVAALIVFVASSASTWSFPCIARTTESCLPKTM